MQLLCVFVQLDTRWLVTMEVIDNDIRRDWEAMTSYETTEKRKYLL